MSNRRRPRNERSDTPRRCRKCRCRDLLLKTGYGLICQRCGYVHATTPPQPEDAP